MQSEKVHVWLSGMTPVAKPPHIPSVVERWLVRRPSSPERTAVLGRGARALPRPLLCAGKKARGWGADILLLLTRSLTHLDTQSHDIE